MPKSRSARAAGNLLALAPGLAAQSQLTRESGNGDATKISHQIGKVDRTHTKTYRRKPMSACARSDQIRFGLMKSVDVDRVGRTAEPA